MVEAENGSDALTLLTTITPDFVILDLMLPDMDGFALCEQLRSRFSNLPILILSARGQDMDKVMGLELGADDYMVKPFNPLELVARVRSILRRTNQKENGDIKVLKSNGLELNERSKVLKKAKQIIKLTGREYDLLVFFMKHPNVSFSRDELLNEVWGTDYFGDVKTVDVHIRRLREKIEAVPSKPLYLETVWGHGYRFNGDS
ncbi:MAG TPA: response regulator transcription factor [Bacilli bacterium]|nr:response regulator transcription factor [Bacilli bacterium]